MLFVMSSLVVGGSETKVVKIANALARSGKSAGIAYLNSPETLLDQIDPQVAVTKLDRRGKYSFAALRRLRELVDQESDVVIAVNLYPLLYVLPAVRWRRPNPVRTVGLVNTSLSIGKEKLLERIYAPFLKRCDRLIFGSLLQQDLWLQKYGLSKATSSVIYNGVDSEFFAPAKVVEDGAALRRELEIPEGAQIVGSVGEFRPEKSFDHLVNAIGKLNKTGRNCYGVLVGEGAERQTMQQAAIDAGIVDKIRFCGLKKDVRAALSIMDVFVLPSTAVETFSNAALEAMAMARAVVLSDVGGAAEMIEAGKSGLLFPAGDVDALLQILVTLYDSDEKRRSLGSAARERVVTTFGFAGLVRQYAALANT